MLSKDGSSAGSAAVLAAVFLACAVSSCSRGPKIRDDAAAQAFFEKARLIMTAEEERIFRGIPDRQARAAFIEDFWKMRDPNYETEVNEARVIFEQRAAFANKWFSRFDPYRGRDVEGKGHPEDGCSSPRGLVYVLLGPPQRMTLIRENPTDWDIRVPWFRKITDESEFVAETWHYDDLRMAIGFQKTSLSGRWELDLSAHAADRLDIARQRLLEDHYRGASTKPLTLRARHEGGAIRLEIPAEGIAFDNEWKALLGISVNVYRGGQKVDAFSKTERLDETAQGPADGRAIVIEIPYDPPGADGSSLEVIVEDKQAPWYSKVRALIVMKPS